MKIDISRMNLSEKDIEDWLYENPEEIYGTYGKGPITRWFGRQYQLPSGVADLIGVRTDNKLVVIEVKNVPINKAAVLQVCRYAADLMEIAGYRLGYPETDNWQQPHIEKVLVGPSIDAQTFTEATALEVRVWQFAASLTLDVSRLYWDKEQEKALREKHEDISFKPEWDIYGIHVHEAIERDKEAHRLEEERILQGIANATVRPVITMDEYDALLDAITGEEDAPDSE